MAISQLGASPSPPLFADPAGPRRDEESRPPPRRRSDPSLPPFGPVVEIVNVTAVVPAPAAINVGLKLQLVSAGKFAHAKLTAPLNVPPPTGAAEKL
jgi:hypothetical protein